MNNKEASASVMREYDIMRGKYITHQTVIPECELNYIPSEIDFGSTYPHPGPYGGFNRPFMKHKAKEELLKDMLTPKPKKVIFNKPATIVIWKDGTKTVVKAQKGDKYDKEKGLALCYMKKALGNHAREFNDALKEAEK